MITKGGALWAFFVKLVQIDMAIYSDHADSFELDHFDQNFHLIFWLKVNNDTVFEAIIVEYRISVFFGGNLILAYIGSPS